MSRRNDPLIMRLRPLADLHVGPNVRAFVELGDNRAFGEQFATPPNRERLTISQAVVDVPPLLGTAGKLTFRPGRFEVSERPLRHPDIDAYAIPFDGGCTVARAPMGPRPGLRANLFSGDRRAGDGTAGTFVAASPRAAIRGARIVASHSSPGRR